MISVIVCSINESARSAFAGELAATIGVPYELILVKNEEEKLSICAAYNKGASRAKYPFFCFVHEDLTFHTPGWGAGLVRCLETPGAGMLGFAGSTMKTHSPSPWWITHEDPLALPFRRLHYIQSGIRQSRPAESEQLLQEVLCLDGFFLACSKTTWEITGFDERTLRGFHFYDMDISLSAHAKGLKNYVYTGCWVEHHSSGSLNIDWVRGAEAFQRKWRGRLPLSLQPVPAGEQKELERLALVDYLYVLVKTGCRWLWLKYFFRLIRKYGNSPSARMVGKVYLKQFLPS
ncbi:MAG TPA: glycosyltransferase [Puia sp.]|nr:glycosyltransferase [Puia sp.]